MMGLDFFRRSIELNPGYANSHHWYAELLAVEGRSGEAISEMQKAIDINPVSHNFLADLGQIYYFDRRFAEAEQYCKKALEIYPDLVFAHEYLFSIYLHTGENDRALEASIRADEINSSITNPSTKEQERIDSYVSLLRSTYKLDGMRGYATP